MLTEEEKFDLDFLESKDVMDLSEEDFETMNKLKTKRDTRPEISKSLYQVPFKDISLMDTTGDLPRMKPLESDIPKEVKRKNIGEYTAKNMPKNIERAKVEASFEEMKDKAWGIPALTTQVFAPFTYSALEEGGDTDILSGRTAADVALGGISLAPGGAYLRGSLPAAKTAGMALARKVLPTVIAEGGRGVASEGLRAFTEDDTFSPTSAGISAGLGATGDVLGSLGRAPLKKALGATSGDILDEVVDKSSSIGRGGKDAIKSSLQGEFVKDLWPDDASKYSLNIGKDTKRDIESRIIAKLKEAAKQGEITKAYGEELKTIIPAMLDEFTAGRTAISPEELLRKGVTKFSQKDFKKLSPYLQESLRELGLSKEGQKAIKAFDILDKIGQGKVKVKSPSIPIPLLGSTRAPQTILEYGQRPLEIGATYSPNWLKAFTEDTQPQQ